MTAVGGYREAVAEGSPGLLRSSYPGNGGVNQIVGEPRRRFRNVECLFALSILVAHWDNAYYGTPSEFTAEPPPTPGVAALRQPQAILRNRFAVQPRTLMSLVCDNQGTALANRSWPVGVTRPRRDART